MQVEISQKTLFENFSTKNNPLLIEPGSSLIPDLIIFPTNLLAKEYRKKLIQKGIPHNPDWITTLHDFCRKYHDDHAEKTRIISNGQALVILSRSLEHIKDTIPFFFTHGYPSSGTIHDLLELRSIISQRCIDFASHQIIEESEKCRQISLILTSYKETLTTHQLLDTSSLIEWTIRHITEQNKPLFSSVRIQRLFEIMPREMELIQSIRNHARNFRFEYPEGKDPNLCGYPDWVRPEEASLIESDPDFFLRSDIFTSNPEPLQDDCIRAGIFSSTIEEIESIAEEICVLAGQGTLLSEITIAFPKISQVITQIQEILDDFGIPYYSCVGKPLIQEPVIGFLLLFPSLAIENYPRERIISLISSPYLKIRQQDLPQISLAEFDKILRISGIEGGTQWEEALSALKNPSDEIKKTVPWLSEHIIEGTIIWMNEILHDCNLFNEVVTPSGFLSTYKQVLKKWMNPEYSMGKKDIEDTRISREWHAVRIFFECLLKTSSLFDPTEKPDLSKYLRYLNFQLEEQINLTEDTGGIRIMGFRQTVGMHYSHLFLGGLVEGDIPYPSTRFPLLTSLESQNLGSRGLHEAIRGEQYYFISTLAAGKKIWLSASETRRERKILTSSFFERTKKFKKTHEWKREIIHSQKRAAIKAGKIIGHRTGYEEYRKEDALAFLPVEQNYGSIATRIHMEDWFRKGIQDSKYDGILTQDSEIISWLSGTGMFGPDRIWSPTQIETYAHCPFSFFLERVVKIVPLPDTDPTLSPAMKGTVIHKTLCDFYSQWCKEKDGKITSRNLEEASELLLRIGQEQVSAYTYQSPAWHATVASLMGFDTETGLFIRFLNHEVTREGDLKPESFEVEIKTMNESSGEISDYVTLESDEGEKIRIRGRIDRIDRSPEGYFAILDYKTGTQYPNGKRISEGKALQLPLYLLALEKMHIHDDLPYIGIGGSYLEISRKIKQTWPLLDPEKKLVAGFPRGKGTTGFHDVAKGALKAAQKYIAGIQAGIFPVTQEKCNTSSYCPYSGICRYNKFRNTEQEE